MIGTNYGVSNKSIEIAEEALGIIFPRELKKHWLDVGYGRVLNGIDNDNRFFSPAEVYAFRQKLGEFKGRKKLKGERDRLCFFMENEENFYSLDLGNHKVYCEKEEVADSIEIFMKWIEMG